MKPETSNFLNFYKHQISQPQWKRTGKDWLASLLALRSLGVFISSLKEKLISVLAAREQVATLTALVNSVAVNKRLYVGLILVGIVAPLSGCCYMLFDKTVSVDGWYYINSFYLLLVLAPSIKEIFICIGVFHLFPQDSKRAYLLAIPCGFSVGKILWLITITSNDQFHAVMPNHLVFTGVLLSAVTFLSIDFFAWRKYHRVDAFERRLEGIYQVIDDLPAEKVVSMFRQTWREKKEFPKQY